MRGKSISWPNIHHPPFSPSPSKISNDERIVLSTKILLLISKRKANINSEIDSQDKNKIFRCEIYRCSELNSVCKGREKMHCDRFIQQKKIYFAVRKKKKMMKKKKILM